MLIALNFPQGTYYKALVSEPSNKKKSHHKFSQQVLKYFLENKKIYGADKLCRIFNDNGITCSIKRVQSNMKLLGIRSVVVKKYNHKSNQGKVPDNKEDLLKRDFSTTTINEKLVTDITYIHVLKEGWTYFASVMNLHVRKIIGYSYGKNMTAELAIQAVKNTALNTNRLNGIILHSDFGSQYTSELFENCLIKNGMEHSFSRKGNPYYNACIESFHSVLKGRVIFEYL